MQLRFKINSHILSQILNLTSFLLYKLFFTVFREKFITKKATLFLRLIDKN